MEYEYALAARASGIRMPDVKLFPSSTCEGFFGTRRFDVTEDGGRRHMLSASAIVEVSHRVPALDYESLFQTRYQQSSRIRQPAQGPQRDCGRGEEDSDSASRNAGRHCDNVMSCYKLGLQVNPFRKEGRAQLRYSSARFVVTAGLAATLALAGCSFSSSSETTTSVSDGETTTTTTTKTEDGETTTTETTETKTATDAGSQDISELKSYTLDAFGIEYDLPEGFKFTDANGDINLSEKSMAFEMSDEDTCSGFLRFLPSAEQPDVWDEAFLKDCEDTAKSDIEGAGGTVKNATQGKITRGDKEFPTVSLEIDKDGTTLYMEFLYFSVNADGTYAIGQLGATGNSMDKVEAIVNGFTLN